MLPVWQFVLVWLWNAPVLILFLSSLPLAQCSWCWAPGNWEAKCAGWPRRSQLSWVATVGAGASWDWALRQHTQWGAALLSFLSDVLVNQLLALSSRQQNCSVVPQWNTQYGSQFCAGSFFVWGPAWNKHKVGNKLRHTIPIPKILPWFHQIPWV